MLDQVKVWWAQRLRFWRNKRILTQLAREFAKYGVDLRFGTLDEHLNTLRLAHESEQFAALQGDLFVEPAVIDPFKKFVENLDAEG